MLESKRDSRSPDLTPLDPDIDPAIMNTGCVNIRDHTVHNSQWNNLLDTMVDYPNQRITLCLHLFSNSRLWKLRYIFCDGSHDGMWSDSGGATCMLRPVSGNRVNRSVG